jgi:DNA-binding transcriptional MerR regulator
MGKFVEHRYSLRQVVELTGISEFTLRGWESRHQAFEPRRTPTGRRRYSSEDILRAKALFDLTERGYRIGAIADLPTQKLHGHLEVREAEHASATNPEIAEILKLAMRFDWDSVEAKIKQKVNALSARSFIHDFVLPLLAAVGVEAGAGRFSVAQEHIISAFLKEKLFALKAKTARKKSKVRLVLATPEGDFHELGILIAAVLASLAGAAVLYLGPSMPAKDLCDTCLRFNATHLLLSATVSKQEGAKSDLLQIVSFLDRQLAFKTTLWLAGRASTDLTIELERPFSVLNSFRALEAELKSG